MTPRSLTSRLSVVLVLVTLLVAAAAGASSYRQALGEAQSLQDDVLQQVAALAASAGSQQLTTDRRSLADSAADIDVTTLAGSRLDPGTPPGLLSARVAGVERRLAVVRPDAGPAVVASQPLAARDEIAHDAALSAVLPLLVLLPVLLLALVLATRHLLAPVHRLADEVRGRDASDLGPLDEHRAPVELRGFIEALNTQLRRVSSAIAHERTFIAQAAHELRTPLTAASLQLERAAGAPDEAHLRARLRELRGGIDRARHVVDQLLDLARARAEADPGGVTDRFDVLLRGVLSDLLPLADRAGAELVVESGANERALLPSAAATSCLRNVVDNAIRYGSCRGQIVVAAARRAERLVVTVDDGGPGVSAPQDVMRPFVRDAPQGVEGSGLGLAVVAEQMRRIGGTVTIGATDRFPTGTCVTLDFPVLDRTTAPGTT